MSEIKHTPLPWRLDGYKIKSAEHEGRHIVAESDSFWGLNRGGENAAFIVEAVNNYEQLKDENARLTAQVEGVRARLKEHWLQSVVCDHEAKTDKSVCWCGWTSDEGPNVGAAVDAYIEHVLGGAA